MTFSNKVPGPVAAMMREIEGLRLKDRATVAEGYKDELSKAEAKRKQAQTTRELNLSEAANQEAEYIGNANLVAEALEGIDAGIRQKIARVKNSSRQTWELFCKENPLNRAIQNVGKGPAMARVFFCLLNPKEPQFCIDYTVVSNDKVCPAYEDALTLRGTSKDAQEVRNTMVERILKDLPKFSKDENLGWYLKAVSFEPKLINLPIPDQQGFTAAMQLAKDNHLSALLAIDNDFDGDYSIAFEQEDNLGKTMLNYAIEQGHKELSLWLLEKTKLELSPIEKACIKGDLPELERLLAITDGSVNPAIRENAPLLWAVMHGKNDVVTKLIASNRIDITANNNIAIIIAVRYGYLEIVKQLAAAGADIYAQNDLALKAAKALITETQESRKIKQEVLDFVCKTRFNTEKSTKERKARAANKIQYLWKNYQVKNNEAKEWAQLMTDANASRAEAAALQAQRELEEFHRTRPLTVTNIEEARRLNVAQQAYLVRNSRDYSSITLVLQVNPSVRLSGSELSRFVRF